jgi:hypothetical protein
LATKYHIYGNGGGGGAVDYGTPIGDVATLTFDTSPLTEGRWRFGVRAYDDVSGLEETNVDWAELIVGPAGEDMTNSPEKIRVVTGESRVGLVNLFWLYREDDAGGRIPDGYRIYGGLVEGYGDGGYGDGGYGGSDPAGSPIIEVEHVPGTPWQHASFSPPVTEDETWSVVVTAYNDSGESPPSDAIILEVIAVEPSVVDNLTGEAV